MLKKWLSYLYPMVVYKEKSDFSKSIEITWANGHLVLDSANTNYSYGSLQRILRVGLKKIGFDTIKNMQQLLVLGVAGGSVIKTLVDEIGFDQKILGIEIDPKMIAIANTYFNLDKVKNLEILQADAFDFVMQTDKRFDLIVIDIFEDTKMPDFLYDCPFVLKLSKMVSENGFILFNTMMAVNNRNQDFIDFFDTSLFLIEKISRIEKFNELIIVKKTKLFRVN